VEIVHLRKNRRCRGGDGDRPHDADLGGLQGNDDGKHHNDGGDRRENDEDLLAHGGSFPNPEQEIARKYTRLINGLRVPAPSAQ